MRHPSDPPSIVEEAIFTGFVAATIPALVTYLFRAWWPGNDRIITAGIAYASFGVTTFYFAGRRERDFRGTSRLPGNDFTWFLRSHVARSVAAGGAIAIGLLMLAMRFMPLLVPQAPQLATAGAGLLALATTIFLISGLRGAVTHSAFWHGYLCPEGRIVTLTFSQALVLGASLITAFFLPIIGCFHTAILSRL